MAPAIKKAPSITTKFESIAKPITEGKAPVVQKGSSKAFLIWFPGFHYDMGYLNYALCLTPSRIKKILK